MECGPEGVDATDGALDNLFTCRSNCNNGFLRIAGMHDADEFQIFTLHAGCRAPPAQEQVNELWICLWLVLVTTATSTQLATQRSRAGEINQAHSEAGLPGQFLTARALVPVATDTCLSLGDELWAPDVTEIGRCIPGKLEVVGHARGSTWVARMYRRRWLVSPSDTSAETEIVLFTSATVGAARFRADSARLTPVWHYRYEDETLRSVTLQVSGAEKRGVVIAAEECVNGTGGCAQSFSRYDGRDHAIVREFLNALERRYPGAARHGYHVTLLTMRAEAALYSDSDPNCCPSHTAHMRLSLRGDSLVLASLQVRP
jgi:hypothetical protein